MIKLTPYRCAGFLYLAAAAIASVKVASTSSQWHGIKSIVKEFDGTVHECQDTAEQIRSQIEEELKMTITLHFWILAFLLVPVLFYQIVCWSAPKDALKADKQAAVVICTLWTWVFMGAARWLP